jgi:polyhydroxyalkanoate synthesis regulator phasin
MRILFERSVLAGIGVLSMTHEKAQKIIDELIRCGEVQKDEAKDWFDRLVQRGDEKRQSLCILIHDEVQSTLDELGLVTKQDLQDLASKIETPGKQEKGCSSCV